MTNKQPRKDKKPEPGAPILACLYRKLYKKMSLKLVLAQPEVHFQQLYTWVTKIYTPTAWKPKGSFSSFYKLNSEKLKANEVIILIAYLNDLPVGVLETFPIIGSHLNHLVNNAGPADMGLKLLMAPHSELIFRFGREAHEISKKVLHAALEYLFYNAKANRVFTNIDTESRNSRMLAQKAGFKLNNEIVLPDMTTALYKYKSRDFLREYPQPITINRFNLFADNQNSAGK